LTLLVPAPLPGDHNAQSAQQLQRQRASGGKRLLQPPQHLLVLPCHTLIRSPTTDNPRRPFPLSTTKTWN
jgi:hypothetical protein